MPSFDLFRRRENKALSRQESLNALRRFLNAGTMSEKRAILEREQQLLLSNMTDRKLVSIIEDDLKKGNHERAAAATFHRSLLHKIRQVGIGEAWKELEEALNISSTKDKNDLVEIFLEWLAILNPREACRFLEKHSELIYSNVDDLLKLIINFMKGSKEEWKQSAPLIQNCLTVLNGVKRRGSTTDAIREAYIDVYGALFLDLPSWLEDIWEQVAVLQREELAERTAAEQEYLVHKAISKVEQETDLAPAIKAELQMMLGDILMMREVPHAQREQVENAAMDAYEKALKVYTLDRYQLRYAVTQQSLGTACLHRATGERRENLEQALASFGAALQVYTQDDSPDDWASIQSNRGIAYSERIAGERRENQEEAIACFDAALQVRTRDAFPFEWAEIQQNLANTYHYRIEGERRENLEQAIAHGNDALQIFTLESFPVNWASIHVNLGTYYFDRIEGDRRNNLERAIACYETALTIYTQQTFPRDWALTQFNQGNAYAKRITGEPRTNQEKAIDCYEAALQVLTRKNFPQDWAGIQINLGNTYRDRIEGEQRTNLERAITCYEKALEVLSRESYPEEWAYALSGLGDVYSMRIEGKKRDNLEKAVASYEEVLQFFTYASFPRNWALTQHNLGNIYRDRIEGEPRDNLERAIACFEAALMVYTRDAYPIAWGMTQHSLGNTYAQPIAGDRSAKLEQAITCYRRALQVRTREASPVEWASSMHNLANTYAMRIAGERRKNLEQAIVCYEAALQVYTCDTFPRMHRPAQFSRAEVAAELGDWVTAQQGYLGACNAEDILLRLGAGVEGHDIVLAGKGDAATRAGYALTRLGHTAEAAVAIESGRARGLAEALSLTAADPKRIHDAQRRERYEVALEHFVSTQATLNRTLSTALTESERRQKMLELVQALQKAQATFNHVLTEIQQAQDPPNFIENALDETTILRASECGGAGHVLVYLAATPWGGIAVSALSSKGDLNRTSRFVTLDLPLLTEKRVLDLLDTRLDDGTQRVIGGYGHAQENMELAVMFRDWASDDMAFREMSAVLHAECSARNKESTFDDAAQEVLSIPALSSLIDTPLGLLDMEEGSTLMDGFWHALLRYELRRCFRVLGEIALSPLVASLRDQGVTSLTLIPCGRLAAFPLANIPLSDGRTVIEVFPTSVAPSARSLLRHQYPSTHRSGVYALGDPDPMHQPLVWGEAEALTFAKIARTLDLGGYVKVQEEATRQWLVQALQRGRIVDISCHGMFDMDNFMRTALLLAKKQRLQLESLLSYEVDVRAMRLLILSACQTAVLDLYGAVNEVRSLAVGMLQAGADAVLASLWSVNDRATYLLMVHFAQEWLPKMSSEAPAAALAHAQQWLRTVTNRELLQWEIMSIPKLTVEEQNEAGAAMKEIEEEDTAVLTQDPALKGGLRHDIDTAHRLISLTAKKNDPDALPYADPIYWAGFQITGW